jgi:hypothetical protein
MDVHGNDRVAGRQEPFDGLVDMPELRVPVRISGISCYIYFVPGLYGAFLRAAAPSKERDVGIFPGDAQKLETAPSKASSPKKRAKRQVAPAIV